MPTYEYECEACGHAFELFQSMTDPVRKKCPECGKLKLIRLIGAGAGLIFKGSGFYITDYKHGKAYKAAAEAEGGKKVEKSKEASEKAGSSSAKSDGGSPSSGKSDGSSPSSGKSDGGSSSSGN